MFALNTNLCTFDKCLTKTHKKQMKKSEITASLLAFGFVGLVSVVFFAFVISPILGVSILATGGFVSIL